MIKAEGGSRKAKKSRSPVAGHRSRLIVAAAFTVLTLAGCDYFGFTPIKDIVATPGQFDGKEVKIKGKVADPVQVLSLKTFTVRQEGAEITVSTDGTLPAAGADVAAKGVVKSAVIVGGKSLGLHVKETQRLK
jgi:hypothetical protein